MQEFPNYLATSHTDLFQPSQTLTKINAVQMFFTLAQQPPNTNGNMKNQLLSVEYEKTKR